MQVVKGGRPGRLGHQASRNQSIAASDYPLGNQEENKTNIRPTPRTSIKNHPPLYLSEKIPFDHISSSYTSKIDH